MKKVLCISAILLLFGSVLTGCPSATPTTPAITSFEINNDDASTSSRTVTLNNECTGIPAQYMASESASFTDASWETYTSAPSFILSSGTGIKTVYFKVKNTVGETAAVSDTITLNEIPVGGTEETVMLRGDVPLVMIWCPAGSFMMGATTNEVGSNAMEKPQHHVTLTHGFWMGKYEVTQAQWQAVMETNPSQFTGDLSRPVENITYANIQSFITALNSYTGLTFRLPTEAQWEYAARAGTTPRFYWGDDPNYTLISDYAWCNSNNGATTKPVGGKLPNAWGLYDVSGNVCEWCQDWWGGSYTADAVTDPTGPATGLIYIVRGGSWFDSGIVCRSAYRRNCDPTYPNAYVGLRLAR